jgi:D-amino peptidase
MNVYISVDMEGCSGVVHREQTNPTGVDYALARRLMTEEANAAIRGAFEGGAKQVVVSDSHGGNGMRNLLIELLDERAELILGSPRALGQMEGLDASFDAVLLIGYHTRHGAAGVLSHTTNGQAIANVWVNEQLLGEIGLNALLAGHFGIPVALISGDDKTIAEAQTQVPGAVGITVKQALGRYAARCLHPVKARALIQEGTKTALARLTQLTPLVTSTPATLRVQFKETGSAESAATVPGATLIADDTVELVCQDMVALYEAYRTLVALWQPAWGGWIRG